MDYGNTKIIEKENNLSIEEKKDNLTHLYDVLNEIAKRQYEEGIDISDCFYTEEQYKEILKEDKNLI